MVHSLWHGEEVCAKSHVLIIKVKFGLKETSEIGALVFTESQFLSVVKYPTLNLYLRSVFIYILQSHSNQVCNLQLSHHPGGVPMRQKDDLCVCRIQCAQNQAQSEIVPQPPGLSGLLFVLD